MGTRHASALKGTPVWNIVAAVALLALVQIAPLPPHPKILSVINNFAHGPVFGALAFVLLTWLRPRLVSRPCFAYVAAFTLAASAGLVLEALQVSTRRDASIADALTNAMGAGCCLSVVAYFDRSLWRFRQRSRRRLVLFAGALQLIVLLVPVGHALFAYAARVNRFPTIMQFTSVLDMYFIELRGCNATFVGPVTTESGQRGSQSLQVRCYGNDWPGISHTEPSPDWSRYHRLRIDVSNPGEGAITLGLRINDIGGGQVYEDRFNGEFEIPAGIRRVLEVNLADIASSPENRQLDLSRIGGFVLFRVSPKSQQASQIILTRVWLE